jgi:TPR repeat protein
VCVALLLLFILPYSILAQSEGKSPVFRKNRPPAPLPIVESTDNLYEIWQTFLVTRRANAGDMLAQHELGLRHLFGRGTAPDSVSAVYWIRRAADQSYPPANFNLGILAYHGWGMEWNPFEAYTRFLFAAQHGMPEAEYVMAQFLTENLVVPRNYGKAYEWLKKSAQKDFGPAKLAVAQFEKEGIGHGKADSVAHHQLGPNTGLVFLDVPPETTDVVRNDTLLLREAIRHAGPGLRKALGMSSSLEGETPSDSAALGSIRRAAENGSPEALTVLGRAYQTGAGVEKNEIRAAALLVRAIRLDALHAPEVLWNLLKSKLLVHRMRDSAAAGNAEAEFAWAGASAIGFDGLLAQSDCYITDDQAYHLLLRAAEHGYLPAYVEVGLCHYAGRGVPADRKEAARWWEKGRAKGSIDAAIRLALIAIRARTDSSSVATAVSELVTTAREGSVLAETGMGFCFETGCGVTEDKAQAAEYYRAASVRGSQDAFRALRRMHDAIRPAEKEFAIGD